MKIEMTDALQTELRNVLFEKYKRLEFSSTVLEIRLKQASLKLQDLIGFYAINQLHLDQIWEKIAARPNDSKLRDESSEVIHKLQRTVLSTKIQMDRLFPMVLFDLPLAIAIEKAQLAFIHKFLNHEATFFETEAA